MEEQDKYNEKMCRYIWHDALQCSIKTLSWGVDFARVKVIENGTEFHVQGFKVTGIVRVQYVEGSDLFKVTIIPDNNQEKPIITQLAQRFNHQHHRSVQQSALALDGDG